MTGGARDPGGAVALPLAGWEDGGVGREERDETWWVYMIACRGGRIYTGTALDPEARFRAHRNGKGAAFTRANPPEALLRSVPFGSRSEACKVEATLKKLPREEKLAWARGGLSCSINNVEN